jgi:glycosyltransferase involved in cell wall biosynthesis
MPRQSANWGIASALPQPAKLERRQAMNRPAISVICITLNEERNLPGLLDRLNWADEVVVVDGGSRDATCAVARSRGARVCQRPFDNFARQQNFALSLARGDWVLSLDADERPTTEMIAEIRQRVRDTRYDAFRVRIRSSIFGRVMRFSGTQDDRQVRLVRRGQARWQGEVHETLETTGAVGQLHSWLDHDPLPNLAAFLTKMHRYTTLAAEARVAGNRAPRGADAWLSPAREVFRRLIWKQGLCDGPEGWCFCLLSGLSEWVLAHKHRRLWNAVTPWGDLARSSGSMFDDLGRSPHGIVPSGTIGVQ